MATKGRKCKWIVKETGLPCGKLATEPVWSQAYDGYDHELFKRTGQIKKIHHPAKIESWMCPEHAKAFNTLRMAADAVVYHQAINKGN